MFPQRSALSRGLAIGQRLAQIYFGDSVNELNSLQLLDVLKAGSSGLRTGYWYISINKPKKCLSLIPSSIEECKLLSSYVQTVVVVVVSMHWCACVYSMCVFLCGAYCCEKTLLAKHLYPIRFSLMFSQLFLIVSLHTHTHHSLLCLFGVTGAFGSPSRQRRQHTVCVWFSASFNIGVTFRVYISSQYVGLSYWCWD